jgi:hypothetical protein
VQENFVSQERCLSRDESERTTGPDYIAGFAHYKITLESRNFPGAALDHHIGTPLSLYDRYLFTSHVYYIPLDSAVFVVSTLVFIPSSINPRQFPSSHRRSGSSGFELAIIIPIIEIITANRRQLQLSRALIVRWGIYSRRRIRHVIWRYSAVKAALIAVLE